MPEGSRSSTSLHRRSEESSRLSSASTSSDERASSVTPSVSTNPSPSGQRPLSLTACSESSSDNSFADPQLSSSPETHQNQCPGNGEADGGGPSPSPERRGHSFVHNKNNNNGAWTPNRASSRRQPPSPFIKATMAPNPQLSYLDRVVMEIIETERTYVRDLRMIVEDYLAYIIDHPDLSIQPDQVCALFGNIEDIYEFNSELLQDLDMCGNNPVAIARCFVMKSEYFDIYTQYCTNYPNSVAALTECIRNKSLAKLFRDRQASLKRTLPLGSYLLKPVQRILKYHLLLQEIAKHFDPEEEGYEVVEEAIYTMTGVAWYINDMKRKHEHAVRLQEVQSLLLNWKGQDLTSYGELVLEGTFKVHRAKNERTLFLFDRMLLITKRRGEHYVYKTHISCTTLMLIESAKDSLSFSVTQYKHPKHSHTVHTVQAKTVEEKKLWAHHIKRIILENHQAIIPQKAKEAILEMDCIYPSKYRYSPERLKKAAQFHSDEPRHGRSQAEPNKQTPKSVKAPKERPVSGGVFADDGRPLQPAVSSSTLDSSGLGESDCERLTREEELEEELGSRKEELERQACTDEEEEEDEGFLLKEEQEAVKDTSSQSKDGAKVPEIAATEKETPNNQPQEKTTKETAKPGDELPSNPDPSRDLKSPQKPKLHKLDKESEGKGEPPSATTDSDSKTLSSAESSDEDDDREVPAEGLSPSILPSSVLDKASAIAQHFTSSVKRGSQAQDDTRSIGCPSPRLPSRTGSRLSLFTETADQSFRLNSMSSDTEETFGGSDMPPMSPREDNVFDPERSIRRRRDSTLSKQDQLLIGKIKNYYESAGSQDSTFSLRRRESLTYIPSGLVRNSVSRFNSIPNDDSAPANSAAMFSLDPLSADSETTLAGETRRHMVTSHSLDSLRSDQISTDSEEHFRSRSQSMHDDLSEDEEFRPSSEIIKVWKEMERQITKSNSEDKACDHSKETVKASREATSRRSRLTQSKSFGPETIPMNLKATDVDSTSPWSSKTLGMNRSKSLKNTLKVFGDDAVFLRATFPRVAQLRAEAEGPKPSGDSEQMDEIDKAKSKVLQLARQYSQRIKSTRPMVRQQSQTAMMSRTTLPRVVEEESSGKPNLTLPNHQDTTKDQLLSPDAALSKGAPQGVAPSTSPISPPPPTESFNWPDVCELRSKYSSQNVSLKGSVSRSASVAEQMFDGGMRRHSNIPPGLLLTEASGGEDPNLKGQGGQEARHRANSLDPRLSESQLSELQGLQQRVGNSDNRGYYIAAEAPLPNDPEHKIIIMEKHSWPEQGSKRLAEEDDDSYVQIRSPTSREKISIMAVIDRCKAYQESDDYKQREEAKAKTEPGGRLQEQDKAVTIANKQDETQKSRLSHSEGGQQSIVKNLREKFQNRS